MLFNGSNHGRRRGKVDSPPAVSPCGAAAGWPGMVPDHQPRGDAVKKKECDCGHTAIPKGCTTGYGTDPETGETHCFACCALRDRAAMVEDGRATLYLCDGEPGQRSTVTNWPGTLRFEVNARCNGRHNIARVRYDVWFRGPDGKPWWGVQYGDNTQICHCRRVKS